MTRRLATSHVLGLGCHPHHHHHALHPTRLARRSGRPTSFAPRPSPANPFALVRPSPNSFTYGPPPYDREDQNSLNNLPRMFKLVAESLGRPVLIGEDTIGGCTLYMHRPSVNPEACDTAADNATCELVDGFRVNGTRHCTVPAGIDIDDDNYHPCPQVMKRPPRAGLAQLARVPFPVSPTTTPSHLPGTGVSNSPPSHHLAS